MNCRAGRKEIPLSAYRVSKAKNRLNLNRKYCSQFTTDKQISNRTLWFSLRTALLPVARLSADVWLDTSIYYLPCLLPCLGFGPPVTYCLLQYNALLRRPTPHDGNVPKIAVLPSSSMVIGYLHRPPSSQQHYCTVIMEWTLNSFRLGPLTTTATIRSSEPPHYLQDRKSSTATSPN